MPDPKDAPAVSLEVPVDTDPSTVAHVMFNNPQRMLVMPTRARDVIHGRTLTRSDVKRTQAPAGPLAAAAGASTTDGASLGVMNDARPFQLVDGVAVYRIRGALAREGGSYYYWSWQGYDDIVAATEQALGAKDVRALMFVIDSPGGEASGCFDAVRKIRALKESSGKPIVAYVDELAASAAYAIASAADEIIVPDTGEVGSIGVILSMFEFSKAFELEGVTPNIITSGKLKATGHYAIEMSDEQRAAVQRDINQLAELFAAEVVEGRGGTVKSWLALEADTRIGKAAITAKLADQVGDMQLAITRALSLAGTRKAASAEKPAAQASPNPSTPSASSLDTEGERARSDGPPSPGVSHVMSNPTVTRSVLALTLCALLAVPVSTTDEELQKKIEDHEKAQAKVAEEQKDLFELLGVSDASAARTQVRELQLCREKLVAKEEAEKLEAEKLEAERKALAEAKAKADSAEKERLIADAHKRGLLSVSHADLLRDAAFSLDRVRDEVAKLDKSGPVTPKKLDEAKPGTDGRAATNAQGRPTWDGKTFEQIDAVSAMLELADADPEHHARMREDAKKRGLLG